MVVDCEVYHLRAFSRIPVFLLGCLIAPHVLAGKKVPLWTIPATGALFVLLEAARLRVSPTSYPLRAAAFIPLALFVIAILAAAADRLARAAAGRAFYRPIAFAGGISLEIYLVQERLNMLLLNVKGYESPDRWDLLKTDMAAVILTVILGYMVSKLTAALIKDYGSTKIPDVADS